MAAGRKIVEYVAQAIEARAPVEMRFIYGLALEHAASTGKDGLIGFTAALVSARSLLGRRDLFKRCPNWPVSEAKMRANPSLSERHGTYAQIYARHWRHPQIPTVAGFDRPRNPVTAALSGKKPPGAKARKRFFRSGEWRRLRIAIFARDGKVCACCHSRPEHDVRLHIDHIVPLSEDWSRRLDPDNLQVLCEDCNVGKSNLNRTDWRDSAPKGASQ